MNINHGDVSQQTPIYTEIPAPEFGPELTVRVRPPTTAEHVLIHKIISNDPAGEYPAQILIAALCAVDSRGDYVFGLNARDAISTCLHLPGAYLDLLNRIALAAAKQIIQTKKVQENRNAND